jgi:CopG family nickel-responsive transcriptional regulator
LAIAILHTNNLFTGPGGFRADLARFGVSIDQRLLERFDQLIAGKGYVSRSEAIRDLIRSTLVEDQINRDQTAATAGTVTLVYDHHTRDLADKLNEYQHSHHKAIVSALHVYLDSHHCLEVVVRGMAAELKRLVDELLGTRGVKHGKLVLTTAGPEMA